MKVPAEQRAISFADYDHLVKDTDRFPIADLGPIRLGLFGEVGSLMSASKKLQREKEAFQSAYERDALEELGDTFWYFAALCRRLGIGLDAVISEASKGGQLSVSSVASHSPDSPLVRTISFKNAASLDGSLLKLGECAAGLLRVERNSADALSSLTMFAQAYVEVLQNSGLPFSGILNANVMKVRGRFLETPKSDLPQFDTHFCAEEQIPHSFEIEVSQRTNGRSYLRMNRVFIGDSLLDNIGKSDDYRFHDVFHFAHAAVLHWSPTFRALIKHKRKSCSVTDEAQDSGRAIVIEEGLSAFVFSHAKEHSFFEDQESVSFDLLKSIQDFVRGYEVSECPLRLWEEAILQGYDVFRKVRSHGGGIVVGDRGARTLRYKPLPGRSHECQ